MYRIISTARLNLLLSLYLLPINLVIFQDPLAPIKEQGNLVLGWASRLYAFSAYPFRT